MQQPHTAGDKSMQLIYKQASRKKNGIGIMLECAMMAGNEGI